MNQSANRIRSYVYVGIQFVCLGFILVTGPWLAKTPLLLAIEVIGVALGLWAVLTMKLRNLSALPDMNPDRPLQKKGPYRWIRHPMYSALLLCMLALVVEEWTYWRGLVWVVLLVNLTLKLHYEEFLLDQIFPDYHAYQKRTHKLIPWIW